MEKKENKKKDSNNKKIARNVILLLLIPIIIIMAFTLLDNKQNKNNTVNTKTNAETSSVEEPIIKPSVIKDINYYLKMNDGKIMFYSVGTLILFTTFFSLLATRKKKKNKDTE